MSAVPKAAKVLFSGGKLHHRCRHQRRANSHWPMLNWAHPPLSSLLLFESRLCKPPPCLSSSACVSFAARPFTLLPSGRWGVNEFFRLLDAFSGELALNVSSTMHLQRV